MEVSTSPEEHFTENAESEIVAPLFSFALLTFKSALSAISDSTFLKEVLWRWTNCKKERTVAKQATNRRFLYESFSCDEYEKEPSQDMKISSFASCIARTITWQKKRKGYNKCWIT